MEEHKQYSPKRTEQFLPVQKVTEDFSSSPTTISTNKAIRVASSFEANAVERITRKGQKINLTVAPSVYTLLLTDFFVGVQSVAVAPTLTLPPARAAGLGKIYIIKDLSGSASATTITISPTGTDTIDGDTSTGITSNYGSKGLYSDQSNWFTV